MLNIAILEDEYVQANHIKQLLIAWSDSKIPLKIRVFEHGEKLINSFVVQDEYDVIFVDVQLGGMDGIAVAKKLRALEFDNTIVFTTNYENWATNGYEVNAYRYFIKPIELRDIKETMDYVLNKMAGSVFQYRYHGETVRIPWDKIISFECTEHYLDVFTIDDLQPTHIKYSLKNVQHQSPSYFVRCQRSHIVNCNYIKKRMGNKLLLINGNTVQIAPRFSKAIKLVLENDLVLLGRIKNHD